MLAGKVAAITGGGSGIGLAIGRAISAAGGSVLLAGRSASKLESAAGQGFSGPVRSVSMNVAEPGAGAALVDAAVAEYGALDVVVANAGVYLPGDLADSDPSAISALIATNVTGTIDTVQAAVRHFVPRGTGDILVTSSVSGHQAIHWEPVYSASKHAVQALVHGVRRQLVGSGVRIGAIAPGVVLNDLWQVTDDALRDAEVAAGNGLTNDDIAEAMMFMLTRARHVQIRDLVILPVNQQI